MFFSFALADMRFWNLMKFCSCVKEEKRLFMNNISHKLVIVKDTIKTYFY